MEPKDPIVWRIIGANVVAWLGAGINAALAPEFGGDAYTAIVAAQNAMVGAFTGALFGGSIGWLIDRHIGNNRRRSGNSHVHRFDHRPTHPDNRPGPRPGDPGSGAGLRNPDNRPGPRPGDPGSGAGLRNPGNRPGPRPGDPGSGTGLGYRDNRPGSVSAVTVVHNGDNIEVSWTPGERATSYEVFYQTSVMSRWTRAAVGHTGTAFVLTEAMERATYTFAVRAVNNAGVSDWTTSVPTSR